MSHVSGSRSLVVYIPKDYPVNMSRLKVILSAVRRVAEDLELEVSGPHRRSVLSVTIKYTCDGGENWVYADWDKAWENWDARTIYKTIRDLILALDFSVTQDFSGYRLQPLLLANS